MKPLLEAAERYPGKVSTVGRLAHRIMAGADVFIVPSLYGPAG
jgi:glycogen synthase